MTATYTLMPDELNDNFLKSLKSMFTKNAITITVDDNADLSPEMFEKLRLTSQEFDSNKGFEIDFDAFLKEKFIK